MGVWEIFSGSWYCDGGIHLLSVANIHIDHMCQLEANRNPLAGYRMGPSQTSHVSPTHKPGGGGSKSPPFKFHLTGWRLTIMPMEHILGHISWLWSDAMNRRTAFARAPNEWTLIEHNMWGRRAARSPFWWWPCFTYSVRFVKHPAVAFIFKVLDSPLQIRSQRSAIKATSNN